MTKAERWLEAAMRDDYAPLFVLRHGHRYAAKRMSVAVVEVDWGRGRSRKTGKGGRLSYGADH